MKKRHIFLAALFLALCFGNGNPIPAIALEFTAPAASPAEPETAQPTPAQDAGVSPNREAPSVSLSGLLAKLRYRFDAWKENLREGIRFFGLFYLAKPFLGN